MSGHHGTHGCGSGPADPRDREDPTPVVSRRKACGIAIGSLAAIAAGLADARTVLATQLSPAERAELADARRQELADRAAADRGLAEDDDREPHVVVVGIDGLRPDAMTVAATPNLDWMIANGTTSFRGFAGGNPVVNEQVTSSGPGWSSICTGVWVDKHGVESNAFLTPKYADAPHFFQRILEQQPDAQLASIVNWEPVNDVIVKGMSSEFANKVLLARPWTPLTDLDANRERDTEVGRLSASLAATGDPAVIFMHLDAVDGAGHGTAFAPDSPEYLRSIESSDASLGLVREAIDARPNRDRERWAYVITTDHGGINNGHGGQTVEERKIPFIVGGDGVPVGEDIHGPGHLAVPPTVLAYLGLPVAASWGWDGDAFGISAV